MDYDDLQFTKDNDMDGALLERATFARWGSLDVMVKSVEIDTIRRCIVAEQRLLKTSHAHVLRYLGIVQDPPKLVMQYLPHGAVSDWLHGTKLAQGNGPVLWNTILKWAYQTAMGLAHLHMENVVHGDLGCHNLLLTDKMDIQVADFSIHLPDKNAKLASRLKHWEAPEALRGDISTYTLYSDAYSLALTLFEMGTRSLPWLEATTGSIYEQVTSGHRPDLERLQSIDMPTELLDKFNAMIQEGWSDDPKSRITPQKVVHVLSLYRQDIGSSESTANEDGTPSELPQDRGAQSIVSGVEEQGLLATA